MVVTHVERYPHLLFTRSFNLYELNNLHSYPYGFLRILFIHYCYLFSRHPVLIFTYIGWQLGYPITDTYQLTNLFIGVLSYNYLVYFEGL